MQDLNKPQLEVGDTVRIDWPRTRWDGRQGILRQVRREEGCQDFGYVMMDGIAVAFPATRLERREKPQP